jgi:outer membrane protein
VFKPFTRSAVALAAHSRSRPGPPGQGKLAYVDSQKILATFPPALDAQKKLEAENNQWAQEFQKMQEDMKALNDKLEQQSLLLSDAKKKEAAQEIQNLAIKAQQYQAEKWGEEGRFFQRRKELLQPVFDKINVIITKIGEEDAYDFIFDTQRGTCSMRRPVTTSPMRCWRDWKRKGPHPEPRRRHPGIDRT